jgi:hypothetical protein
MKWFKHISDSLDDPFIFELMTEFGSDGYLVFFGILEIYSREFKPESDWKLVTIPSYFRQKLRISSAKVKKILLKINKWEVEYNEKQVIIFIPKFRELMDEWSLRKLGSASGVTPKILKTDKDKEVDKDKRIKKVKETPTPKIQFLDSVLLTEEQHKKLQAEMSPSKLNIGIEQLDYSITVKGGKYKDHYKTLLNWFRRGYFDGGNNGKRDSAGGSGIPKEYVGESVEISDIERQKNLERIKGITATILPDKAKDGRPD